MQQQRDEELSPDERHWNMVALWATAICLIPVAVTLFITGNHQDALTPWQICRLAGSLVAGVAMIASVSATLRSLMADTAAPVAQRTHMKRKNAATTMGCLITTAIAMSVTGIITAVESAFT